MTVSKKIICGILSASVVLSFVGCKETGEKGGTVEKLETVSVFCDRSASLGEEMVDYNDVSSFKEMENLTGVKVEWTIPPSSGFEEKFNLMIASGNYADVIVADWKNFGDEKYLNDKVIISLSDYKEYMPNFMAYTEAHPEFAKQYISSTGKIRSC